MCKPNICFRDNQWQPLMKTTNSEEEQSWAFVVVRRTAAKSPLPHHSCSSRIDSGDQRQERFPKKRFPKGECLVFMPTQWKGALRVHL